MLPLPKGDTLRYNSNNPETSELDPDENGRPNVCSKGKEDTIVEEKVKRIAKLQENRERRNRKTLIFGSSHAKSIKREAFNEQLEMGTADILAFAGHTAENITKFYMSGHLVQECPHSVVFVAGGNDIPHRRATTKELETIANYLIEGGKQCKQNYGVTRVFICSILPRSFGYFQVNRHRLNGMLKSLCEENDLVFIDNSDDIILKHHIGRDGIHLNNVGSHLFMQSILKSLNN